MASVLSATAGERPRTGDNERICAARDGEGLLRAIVVGISSNSSAASAVKDSSRLSPTLEWKNNHEDPKERSECIRGQIMS